MKMLLDNPSSYANCSLHSLIGYSFKIPNSIINCPTKASPGIMMPLANCLRFYNGQTNSKVITVKRQISAVSMRGDWIAIGERGSKGQLIATYFFNKKDPSQIKQFYYQKSQIQHIAISPSGTYLVSIGSSDDQMQQLSIIETLNQSDVGTKIFYTRKFPKAKGRIVTVLFSNTMDGFFVVLFVNKVLFMRISDEIVEEFAAKTSKVRQFNNIIFDPKDQFCYGCSKNGDVAQISIQLAKQTRIGPRKRIIINGIQSIRFAQPNFLVISGKKGFVGLLQISELKMVKEIAMQDEIISMSTFIDGIGYLSTNKASIYVLNIKTFEVKLWYACHSQKVNNIAFLMDYSDTFASCAAGQIVLWRRQTLKPIMKIAYPKIKCFCINLPKNAKTILSGWSDDSIRIFSLKKGQMLHQLEECGLGKVLCLITNSDCTKIIAGGEHGSVRCWKFDFKSAPVIEGSFSHHSLPIHSIQINPRYEDQLIVCSEDGSYSVWSINQFDLKGVFKVNNFIKDVVFQGEIKIRVFGSGPWVHECMISDGKTQKKIELRGGVINTALSVHIPSSRQNLFFFGGEEPYLYYFDQDSQQISIRKEQSYCQITKLVLSPDNESMMAATANGTILHYRIHSLKNKQQK